MNRLVLKSVLPHARLAGTKLEAVRRRRYDCRISDIALPLLFWTE